MASKRKPIQYFVFMKAKTTGRQWEDFQTTKIVELSFIAVNQKDLERGEAKKMPASHKMTMVFCPDRYIQDQATQAHDLTDKYVENAPSFGQSASCIVAFLQKFPKPVCLVAHNGLSFDYKHLRGEIAEAEILFPEDLLCADSRWIFNNIFRNDPEITEASLPYLHKKLVSLKEEIEKLATAEDKTLMLLDCVLVKKEAFLEIVDEECKLFSEVKPVGAK